MNKIFTENQSFDDYYLSALIHNRLESSFKDQSIYSKYKIFKYHICYITYFMIIEKRASDKLSYSQIIETAGSREKLKPFFIKSCKIIANIAKESSLQNYDLARNREFTQKITDVIKNS